MKRPIRHFSLLILALSCFFYFTSCYTGLKYEKNENSVTLFSDSVTTKITVVNDQILHVEKYATNSKREVLPDYVTILKPQKTKWELIECGSELTISTSEVCATINKYGEISYTDDNDDELVSETKELTFLDGKDKTHAISQAFTAGDEGLYGLGQFQSGIMNWKNTPVRLQQHNQEIAIPFLVSTNNYGIYWHNYSVTDFNYPENELTFTETVDKKRNIRKMSFTADETGEYTFMVQSENTKGRWGSHVLLSIDTDSIINFSTVWIPENFSGKKHLTKGQKYEIVFQNTDSQVPGRVFYNKPSFDKSVFSSKYGDAIDYYFVYGEDPEEVISEYSKLTGRAPMFPKSALGFWQCRERYKTQAELMENAREMRERKIPFDNIVQDWFYWPNGTKGPEWDRAKYPNPQKMTEELAEMNVNLMVSVWPSVDNAPMLEKYGLTGAKLGKTHYLDFYDEKVRENYYKMLSDSMFHIGVQSIWLDGTEPEDKTEDNFVTSVGEFGKVTNPYSLLVNKAMYEGHRKEFADKRVFNLTRSSYAGQQRYGVTSWSGDVAGTWEQFNEQIAAGLNFVMAGVPYWTTDIGGFFRDETSCNAIYDNQYENEEYIELLTRWFQFGAFNPIFRIHGYASNTEIWRYNDEFEATARKFLDLRYKLMPYIYSEAWKVTNKGKLLMSPLVYHFPKDKNVWSLHDQFMLGESLLVCPVNEYKARQRKVYLPEGDWYDFWTNTKLDGEKEITALAPLNSLPLYVKEGTILPMGGKVQYATQKTDEPITLKVYPGKDAEYTLYFDDNVSYNYENGAYAEIEIEYSDDDKEVEIQCRNNNFLDLNNEPIYLEIEIIGTGEKQEVAFYGHSLELNF